MTWKVFILMVLLCDVQPIGALGPHVKIGLYVLVPFIVLLVLAILFRFWWERQQDRRQLEYEQDSYLVGGVQELESPIMEPPMARGTLVLRQTSESPPNPCILDTQRAFVFTNKHNVNQARLHSTTPLTFKFDFETPKSVRTSVCSREHSPQNYMCSAEKRHNQAYPSWNEKHDCFKDTATFSAHLQHANCNKLDPSPRCVDSKWDKFSRCDFSKGKKSRTLKVYRRSKANVYRISDPRPSYARMFPRFKSSRTHTLPTCRDLEVVCERESYTAINALCASLQKAFIDYHNQIGATSITTSAPLKSCLKRGHRQRKTSKHVTFKIKSSIFKVKKKRKSKSKLKHNRTTALAQAEAESYLQKWSPLKDSEHIVDTSIYSTHEVQMDTAGSGTRSAISLTPCSIMQKDNVKTGFNASKHFQEKTQSVALSRNVDLSPNRIVSKRRFGNPEDDYYHAFGDFYCVNGDIYYSGHNFSEKISDFDTRQD